MKALVSLAALTACSSSSAPQGTGDLGYQVVDPMPPPARCADAPPGLHAAATLVSMGPNGAEIEVVLTPSGGATFELDNATAQAPVQIVDRKATAEGVMLRLTGPTAAMSVSITLTCAAGVDMADVTISAPTDPSAPAGTKLEASVGAWPRSFP